MKNLFVLDQSGSMAAPTRDKKTLLASLSPLGERLAREIASRKEALGMIQFSRRIKTSPEVTVEMVIKAFNAHIAYRDSNLKEALRKASEMEGVQNVYVFTDGRPQHPEKTIRQLEWMVEKGVRIIFVAPPCKKEEKFLKDAKKVTGVEVIHSEA